MIINQLPSVSSAADADEIVVEIGTTTYKIKKSDFLKEFMKKSGGEFTGDVTVNGVLDVTKRQCYASLSSAGWYRVLKYSGDTQNAPLGAPSFIIRFGITRHVGSEPGGEAHEITMTAAYNGSIAFSNEISNSKELLIDKIRYTYRGNDSYVDIHYNNSRANRVVVDFDVYVREYVKREIVSQPFVSVAPSPSGETVLAEYSFAENTSDSTLPTLDEYGTSFESGGYVRKINGIVYLRVNVTVKDTPAGGWRSLFTIPTEFSPSIRHDFFAMDNSSDAAIHARVYADGTVSIWPNSAISSGRLIDFYVIFPSM